MEVIFLIFHEVLIRPIITVLVVIYHVLVALHIPSPLGFSIIILTIFIRFITYPLITSQLKTSKKMQELTPHLSKLKEKHKDDATRLQQETMKLYKEHGVNPVAGCLPSLLQLPIIWGLYNVLQQIVGLTPNSIVAKVNEQMYLPAFKLTSPWDPHFFGLSLGQGPSNMLPMDKILTLPTITHLILLVPIITGVLQFLQSKMMFSKPKASSQDKKLVVKDESDKKPDDFASAFQSQSMYIFPVMIGFFSYNFPVGLSLYWNTFTLFGILQQYHVAGLGGLGTWKEKIWTKRKKK